MASPTSGQTNNDHRQWRVPKKRDSEGWPSGQGKEGQWANWPLHHFLSTMLTLQYFRLWPFIWTELWMTAFLCWVTTRTWRGLWAIGKGRLLPWRCKQAPGTTTTTTDSSYPFSLPLPLPPTPKWPVKNIVLFTWVNKAELVILPGTKPKKKYWCNVLSTILGSMVLFFVWRGSIALHGDLAQSRYNYAHLETAGAKALLQSSHIWWMYMWTCPSTGLMHPGLIRTVPLLLVLTLLSPSPILPLRLLHQRLLSQWSPYSFSSCNNHSFCVIIHTETDGLM